MPVHIIACTHDHGAWAVGAGVPSASNREVVIPGLCVKIGRADDEIGGRTDRAGFVVAMKTGAVGDAGAAVGDMAVLAARDNLP